ncbi:hypothetical protein HYW75_01740 [Candidatus Pacearchaeota archaeon]|nr:hypothetical protein [Candidatus Pacearchaeota archaeon]
MAFRSRRGRNIYRHTPSTGMMISAQYHWDYLKEKGYAIKDRRNGFIIKLGRFIPMDSNIAGVGYRRFRYALQRVHKAGCAITDSEVNLLLRMVPIECLDNYVTSILERRR